MAEVKIHIDRIYDNIEAIHALMQKNDKQWSLVVKCLGGERDVIARVLKHPLISKIHSVSSSHWQELSLVKELHGNLRTIVIRPTFKLEAAETVSSSDISLETSLASIQCLNESARSVGKTHSIIVMIEMGDLREGIKREGLIPFYNNIFELKNIRIVGIGANLGCMFGDLPTYDKLLHLVLYGQLLEAKYDHKLELISGGTSITLPLLDTGEVPIGVNHFRIGEAVFLGTTPFTNKRYANLHTNCIEFEANILELYRKESLPEKKIRLRTKGAGKLTSGEYGSYKALVDFGKIDVDPRNLISIDKKVKFFGNSSDLSVYDLGENSQGYNVGDVLTFRLNYMGVAQLMNSKYIKKTML
jgi:predicted amino acid racemase